jgi:benzaldehyde dehydrogenase (NAD)
MSSPTSSYLLDPSLWGGKLFNGVWVTPAGGVYPIKEPATGATVGVVGQASALDVRQAAEIATKAQKAWTNAYVTANGR